VTEQENKKAIRFYNF